MTRPPKDWKKKMKIQIECTVNLLAVRLELFFKKVCEEFVFLKVVHFVAFLGSLNPFFNTKYLFVRKSERRMNTLLPLNVSMLAIF